MVQSDMPSGTFGHQQIYTIYLSSSPISVPLHLFGTIVNTKRWQGVSWAKIDIEIRLIWQFNAEPQSDIAARNLLTVSDLLPNWLRFTLPERQPGLPPAYVSVLLTFTVQIRYVRNDTWQWHSMQFSSLEAISISKYKSYIIIWCEWELFDEDMYMIRFRKHWLTF